MGRLVLEQDPDPALYQGACDPGNGIPGVSREGRVQGGALVPEDIWIFKKENLPEMQSGHDPLQRPGDETPELSVRYGPVLEYH